MRNKMMFDKFPFAYFAKSFILMDKGFFMRSFMPHTGHYSQYSQKHVRHVKMQQIRLEVRTWH